MENEIWFVTIQSNFDLCGKKQKPVRNILYCKKQKFIWAKLKVFY